MTLSKPITYFVGVATFWYALYLLLTIVGIVVFFGYVFVMLMAGGEGVADLQNLFARILSMENVLPIHVCSLFLEVGLLIFYLVHTIRNTKASDSMRVALGLGHLFLPFVAMPIYYYLYIWRETPPEWAVANARKVDQRAKNIV